MGFGDLPPHTKVDRAPTAEVQVADKNDELFKEVFAVKANAPEARASITNLGRIDSMPIPAGWQKGNETAINGGYAREYHPEGKEDVQIVFSYRGSRLSAASSAKFRELIDSAPPEGKSKSVDVKSLQQAPMNEVLGDEGHKNTFSVVSAKVQRINGEPALVVEGKFSSYDVNAKFIYIDADRNNRGENSAPVQEIAFMAPTKEFFKYSIIANGSIEAIHWAR